MRNLKKFLALVMAMVMAFSLMLTVNAAHIGTQYTDEDDVTPAFEEAMEVLTGMGVYQGDPGATFRPASTITRAETAALIYRLATGDTTDARKDLYKDYGNFADVTSTDWFAGYVGYCANAGYIKGHGGYFNPYGQVTGYEVLAMVLRAVGYDKNHEFEGATWQTNVSALSTQLGILKQVKSTDYGDRLYEASRRDVVASLIFETAANVNMVNYTAMAGYNKYTNLVNNELNPTLGYKNFGLTTDTGVIVGNQETGESNTRISFASEKDGTDIVKGGDSVYAYNKVQKSDWANWTPAHQNAYNGAPSNPNGWAANTIRTFKFETGLDEFGHSMKVWYNAKDGSNMTTYAMIDKATLADTVLLDTTAPGYALTVDTPQTSNTLAAAAAAKGFAVSTSTTVFTNEAFDRFVAADKDLNTLAASTSPSNLYMLISNSSNKSLDVVIALNVESAHISAQNDVANRPTITVPLTATTFAEDYKQATGDLSVLEATAATSATIFQNALVGKSTKTLGDYEIGVHINGTKAYTVYPELSAAADANANGTWFKTVKVDSTKEGKVVGYKVDNQTAPTMITEVTLDDGTVLKASILYKTVVGTNTANAAIPQVIARTGHELDNYRFYLDRVGKFIGAEKISSTKFVYGTYLDYGSVLGSSTFQYTFVGVDANGEQVVAPVTHINNVELTPSNAKTDVDIPFRGDNNVNVNNVSPARYRGFKLDGTRLTTNDLAPDWTVGSDAIFNNTYVAPVDNVNNGNQRDQIGTGDVFIGKTAITLGAAKAGTISGSDLYVTDNTKFILVDGTGTDTQKVEVYNGLSELRGARAYVNLRMQWATKTTATNTPTLITDLEFVRSYFDPANAAKADNMTYFSTSNFIYAQNGANAKQADVVIMPKAAVTWGGGSSLYYMGDDTPVLINSTGNLATKFTFYVDGEPQQVWIDGLITTAGNNSASLVAGTHTNNQGGNDLFYELEATSKKANDGETIYTAAISTASNIKVREIYTSSTMNQNTATLSVTGLVNVANAKIVNVNNGNAPTGTFTPNGTLTWSNCVGHAWPGIDNTLTTLNYAGSLNQYGQGNPLRVSVVLNPDNNLIVDTIYVCWVQQSTP